MTTEERSRSAVLSLSPTEVTIGYIGPGNPHRLYIGPSLATGLNTMRVEAQHVGHINRREGQVIVVVLVSAR